MKAPSGDPGDFFTSKGSETFLTPLSSHRGKLPQYWDHAEEEGWAVAAPDQSR